MGALRIFCARGSYSYTTIIRLGVGGERGVGGIGVAASAKMVWRYDNGQNGDLKEEEETPGKDKGTRQDGAVYSNAMEVDEIDFGDSKQKSRPKDGN